MQMAVSQGDAQPPIDTDRLVGGFRLLGEICSPARKGPSASSRSTGIVWSACATDSMPKPAVVTRQLS